MLADIDLRQREKSTETRLIYIIGIDGSGKTTHARSLYIALKNSAEKSRYTWFGSAWFFSFPFMAICRLLGFTKVTKKQDYSEHHYYRNRPIALIWPWVQLIDLIIIVTLRVYIPMWLGFFTVYDRFIPDILVDIMCDVNDGKFHKTRPAQLMLKLIPNYAAAFLFDLDETIAFQRKHDTPNLEYLVIRRRFYHLIAKHLKIPTIDAGRRYDLVMKELNIQLKEYKISSCDFNLRKFEKQLQNRLWHRELWRKWKKGPITRFKNLLRTISYRFFGVCEFERYGRTKLNIDLGLDQFGRNVSFGLLNYIDLLRKRGMTVHTLLVVGSRGKKRGTERSDIDVTIIGSGIPSFPSKQLLLSDVPIFLGVEATAYTKKEFIQRLTKLDLTALDAMYYGKIIYDDEFWTYAKKIFKKIEDRCGLNKRQLKQKLLAI